MSTKLSPDQVDFFRREGYLLRNEPLLTPDEFEALKAHFEEKLTEWMKRPDGKSPEHMDVPHFEDPALFRWLMHDSVLDVVESLIGPDIALWSSHFLCKPAGTGKRAPWHEDSAYWGQVLDPMEVVTIWLAIDPSTPENGCMRVIPGSHHNGYSQYAEVGDLNRSIFSREITANQFDESKAVDMVLAPNECSIHHAKLIHGSNPNHSQQRRCGYTMRYVPARSRFIPAAHHLGFQIYLVRGQDRAGNSYGDPTKPNHAWIKANEAQRREIRKLAI